MNENSKKSLIQSIAHDLLGEDFYNGKIRLLEILKQYYSDPRDPKQVLDMITTKPGLVKLVGNTLMVMLE
ncbi:MAG: hypothetical protein D3923_15160, partial [Candidatus Electrothrix sp. AR3]|nr:hypothetical protein [Candidatus Electrothrix sp. AR3]